MSERRVIKSESVQPKKILSPTRKKEFSFFSYSLSFYSYFHVSLWVSLFITFTCPTWSTKEVIAQDNFLELSTQQVQKLSKKLRPLEILAEANIQSITESDQGTVSSPKQNKQSLTYSLMGLHSESCQKSLRKLSRYENYKDYLAFVKESSYDEKNQSVRFLLESSLLPIAFILEFKLPRIEGPGQYPFTFLKGIFAGLQGKIYVHPDQNRCFFLMQAKWSGPHTGFKDLVVKIFLETLGPMGMEKLFRLSQF